MRTLLVVVLTKRRQDDAGFPHRGKGVPIQAFVTHSSVEALAKPILPRAARVDIQRGRLMVGQPVAQRLGDKFGSVVATDKLRRPCCSNKAASTIITRVDGSEVATSMARPSRVNSSITVSTFNSVPLRVR